eukprot:scaffold82761_cov48-Phaeocystis_antarctica.AAC.2
MEARSSGVSGTATSTRGNASKSGLRYLPLLAPVWARNKERTQPGPGRTPALAARWQTWCLV